MEVAYSIINISVAIVCLPMNGQTFRVFCLKRSIVIPTQYSENFFKYQYLESWLTTWKNIVDGALCPEEARFSINELTIYTHLVKLVEAAHLIDVRETVHVRGHLKN